MKANRREFLKIGSGIAGVFTMASPLSQAIAAACGITPPQTAGPFYPGENEFDQNTDLTIVPGRFERAVGQVVYLRGRVVDGQCNPIAGANVEIWQACATGRYNHISDPNPARLDPNFRYWAEAFTNQNGEYSFKTILPGAYPADTDWTRPPHIHFKISKLGFRDLVTQMYFKGQQLNDTDLILGSIPATERNNVIVEFRPAGDATHPDAITGSFDITLVGVRD